MGRIGPRECTKNSLWSTFVNVVDEGEVLFGNVPVNSIFHCNICFENDAGRTSGTSFYNCCYVSIIPAHFCTLVCIEPCVIYLNHYVCFHQSVQPPLTPFYTSWCTFPKCKEQLLCSIQSMHLSPVHPCIQDSCNHFSVNPCLRIFYCAIVCRQQLYQHYLMGQETTTTADVQFFVRVLRCYGMLPSEP